MIWFKNKVTDNEQVFECIGVVQYYYRMLVNKCDTFLYECTGSGSKLYGSSG